MLSKTARSSAGLFRAASLKLPALSTPVAASCASSLGAALRRSLQTSSVPATPANVPANVAAFISAKHDAHAMQDRADARSLVRLACTLNRDAEDPWFYNPVHGTHPASHWLYCNEGDNTSELNADGYSNIHRPPAPYSVLLWGGGTIHFHDAMMLNDDVQALTRIARPEHKVGKTGDMVLVTRTTDYVSRSKKHLVRDVTNLVYRNANAPKPAERELSPAELEARARPLEKGKDFDWERSTPFETDPRALFRFSALTWNAHRIHYDTAFAQSDGHPGPLVHGPMQATVLLDFAGEISKAIAPAEEPLEERLYNRLLYKSLIEQQNAVVREQREIRSKMTLAERALDRRNRGHSHSHGGAECDHDHGGADEDEQLMPEITVPSVDRLPLDYADVPRMGMVDWHLRYQKLRSMSYRALRPLVAGTRVRVLGQLISDEGLADAEQIARDNAEWVKNPSRKAAPGLDDEHHWKRLRPAKVKVWIQDAEKSDVRYMEGELTFTKLNKEYVGSKAI